MSLAAFLSIAAIHLLAAISPGPSFVVSVRVAAREGFWPALALAAGFGLGAGVWAAGALAGLAVIFAALPALFAALKVLGGLFLLYIAVMLWRHADAPLPAPEAGVRPQSAGAAFRLGLLTFITNPKPAVFFGAVFVGLVPPATPLPWLAAITGVVILNEFAWYVLVARVFSLSGPRAAYGRMKAKIDRLLAGVIGFFGAQIALG